jgi:hypothetical protein
MQARTSRNVGTDVGGRWWDRTTRGGLLVLGNGRMWTDEQGLFFHRDLTGKPLFIARSSVESIESTTFRSGSWARGLPITKVAWHENGTRLRPGLLRFGQPRGAGGGFGRSAP